MAYNNKNTISDEIEIGEDGLRIVKNAANVLYMRKDNFNSKSRICPLEGVPEEYIDYKNIKLLEQFVSERGKILPRRITGLKASRQRLIRLAIKRARVLSLLPFEKKI